MIKLSPQGYRKEQLRVLDPTSIQIGETVYPVYDTGSDDLLQQGKVHVDVIAFDDPETARKMDAAYIQVEPGCSTPIQHWVGPRIYIESIIEGSGTWVGVNPEGDVVTQDFDAGRGENGLLLYGENWIGSWVAGKSGLKFVEICIPPYEDDGTVIVAKPEDERVGDRVIPAAFMCFYRSLVGNE